MLRVVTNKIPPTKTGGIFARFSVTAIKYYPADTTI